MKELYDMHCHIVPGVDDGACDMKMSVRMLQKEYEDGVRAALLPHRVFDMTCLNPLSSLFCIIF